ncbi:PREDICTED: plastin-3-like [Acropora digitifera]|uniref:plastin-3-like n=1 Tax=Acropora digitifera TaxID=70779 RepID=UPI00077AC0D0|nr:PREDICTED: plastin-3-like [Acropora digitifera]
MADSQLTEDQRNEVREIFNQFDPNGDGHISSSEIGTVMKSLGEDIPGYKLRDIVQQLDKNKNGTIEFNEFLEIYKQNSKQFSAGSEFKKLLKKKEQLDVSGGTSESSAEGTIHSYSEAERVAFVDWMNSALKEDVEARVYLPINPATSDVFEKIKDGILLCKMINLSAPDTIDERAVNKAKAGKALSIYKIHENMMLALNSARAIGCNIVNIGAEDLEKGKAHLVLGVLWQIIRIGLFANISLTNVPGLARLLREGETINDLMALSPEEILLRWFNYHLEQEGHHRRVHNFSEDIKVTLCGTPSVMAESDHTKRAEKMLQMADKIGCRKFVRPKDVVAGNSKLNMAFVANLFNTYPGLPPMDAELEEVLEEAREETREERTFRNWMNSIGVSPYVNNLYRDLCSGLVLLQLFDIIQPGIVSWEKVNKPPFKQMGGKMKKIENCNYAVEIGRKVKFSLVGVGGQDIHDCNETLTLGKKLAQKAMDSTTICVGIMSALIVQYPLCHWLFDIIQPGIVSWEKVNKPPFKQMGGKMKKIENCNYAVEIGRKVKFSLVGVGGQDIHDCNETLTLVWFLQPVVMDKHENAKYALSVARKIGATTYALPDDLAEVKPKMVLTVFACLMATDRALNS